MKYVCRETTIFIASECKKNYLLLRRFVENVSLCFVILRLINKRNTITFKRSWLSVQCIWCEYTAAAAALTANHRVYE